MTGTRITSDVHYMGVSHYDRRLFDALIPTPEGTTYNSYLVSGADKTALIDTVEPLFKDALVEHLKAEGVTHLDYIISNHAEQDHSGSIPYLLEIFPEATLVTNEKCRDMLLSLMPEISVSRILVVKDHAQLDLGGGRVLEFLLAPWIHWPETMMTWFPAAKTLFPCDLFGSHLATSDIFLDDPRLFYEPMKRYYAQIMMPYRAQVAKRLETVKALNPEVICPSHGPVFKNTSLPLSLYSEWVCETPKNEVLIPWVSTHGATARMVEHLTAALVRAGIVVRPYDLTVTDLGKVAADLVDAATVAIGTGCILTGAHPMAAYVALLANALKPKAKFATVFGSFGWSGVKVPEQIVSLMPNLKLEIIQSVLVKGAPTAETFASLDKLAEEILTHHRALGIC